LFNNLNNKFYICSHVTLYLQHNGEFEYTSIRNKLNFIESETEVPSGGGSANGSRGKLKAGTYFYVLILNEIDYAPRNG